MTTETFDPTASARFASDDDLLGSTAPPRPTAPPTPIDEACIERIEQMLDATELAIANVEAEDAQQQRRHQVIGELKLTVVIPVYNEKDTIREIVRRVQNEGLHFEIVIVDDFSTDGTRDILLELEGQEDVRVLWHGYNRGKGAALQTAFQRVKGDVVLVQDADLEYDPKDYATLLEPIKEGRTDVVYGSRYLGKNKQSDSRWHRFGNSLLTWCSNRMTGQELTDMETCYKVFRRRVLHSIELEQERFGFEPEVTAKISRLGHTIEEVPIRYNGRGYAAGKKIGMKDAINAIWCILKYRWRR